MSTGNPLVPCPSCARHVRALDANCPFCNGALPTNLASRAVPAASQRLGRGAAFVFASSLAMQACASSSGTGDAATQDSSPSDSAGDTVTTEDMGGPVAAYGAPADVVVPDASAPVDAASDAGGPDDSGGNVAAYGLPAPVDAGTDASDDAGDGGGGARYGAPPARDYDFSEWI